MLDNIKHWLWVRLATSLNYVRVAGLVTKHGQLVEEGSFDPLTRSNVCDGYLTVDAKGDLWWRFASPRGYGAYADRWQNQRVVQRIRSLSPRGFNDKLSVGFGNDEGLDRLDELVFDDEIIKNRKANPYWAPSAQAA